MPLWQIYHPPGTFEDHQTRQALSQDVTKIYTSSGLPAFYVVVQFISIPPEYNYIGGRSSIDNDTAASVKPFIRIKIDHIAIRLPDNDAVYRQVTNAIDVALKPYIADKGYEWEYHVDETERRLWKINGMIPPPWKSEEERLWSKENRTVVYDGAYPQDTTSSSEQSRVSL